MIHNPDGSPKSIARIMRQQVKVMSQNLADGAQFTLGTVRQSLVMMAEIASGHHLAQDVASLFLIRFNQQQLFGHSEHLIHNPHHAFNETSHSELLDYSKNPLFTFYTFFTFRTICLQDKEVVHQLPHSNSFIQEMSVGMQQDVEQVELHRRANHLARLAGS